MNFLLQLESGRIKNLWQKIRIELYISGLDLFNLINYANLIRYNLC